jgi:hypothetical protein
MEEAGIIVCPSPALMGEKMQEALGTGQLHPVRGQAS